MTQEYARRIWAGDRATVAEARERYRLDRERYLIPFAVVLYSFRTDEQCARELLELRGALLLRARRMLQIGADRLVSPREYANRADVLSTYLEWMGRRGELSREQQAEVLDLAYDVAFRGQVWAYEPEVEDHTRGLLLLTIARIGLTRRDWRMAEESLARVARMATSVTDANQRVRIYRKLGLLNTRYGRLFRGLYWGIRACVVPGVPMAVRLKSVAAIIGVDS